MCSKANNKQWKKEIRTKPNETATRLATSGTHRRSNKISTFINENANIWICIDSTIHTDFKVNIWARMVALLARARVCVFLCVIIVVPNTYVCLLTPFVFSACMINACGRTLYSVPNYTKHNKHKILLFNGQLEWMFCALPDFWRLRFQRMAFFALIFWLELSERIFSRVCALFCALFGHSFPPFHTGAELFHFISISFSHSGLVWRPMEAPIATNLVHSTFDIHTWSESLRKVLLHPAWTLPIFLPMLKCGQWMDLSADIWVVCLILMTFFFQSTHLHIKFDNKFLCSDCWSVRGLD